MADELIAIAKSNTLIFIGFWLMVLGSIVDLTQFTWMVTRWQRKRQRRLEANIRAKIIVEEFDRRREPKGLDV